VQTVRELGCHSDGFLVGSHLTGHPDIDWAARMLVYGPNKVCGLTSRTAAQAARAVGAVYGGLIFEEPSPRNVSRETAKDIIVNEPGLRYVAVSRRTEGWTNSSFRGSTQCKSTLRTKVLSTQSANSSRRSEQPSEPSIRKLRSGGPSPCQTPTGRQWLGDWQETSIS